MSRWLSAAAAVSVVALTAGCGSSSSAGPSVSPTPTLSAAQQAACAALLKIPQDIFTLPHDDSPPPVPLMKEIAAQYDAVGAGTTGMAATAAKASAATIKEVIRTKNYNLLNDDSFGANTSIPMASGRTVCGWTGPTLTAMSHPAATAGGLPKLMFMDVPKTLPPGNASIDLKNDAKGPHELIVIHLKDSYTGTLADFKKLSDTQMQGIVAGPPVVAFAPPKQTATLNVTLAPGRYLFFCHIPLSDTKGDPVDKNGKPTNDPTKIIWHYLIGMLYEVQVS